MCEVYCSKLQLIPYNEEDYSLISSAMKDERKYRNKVMSLLASTYFSVNQDIENNEAFRGCIAYKNPIIQSFANPLLDKKLLNYELVNDLRVSHYHGLKEGTRSIPSYSKDNRLLVQGDCIKFSNKYGESIKTEYLSKDFEVILLLDKPFCPKKYFKVVFGNPKTSRNIRKTVMDVILGKKQRSMCSFFSIDKGDLFLNLCVNKVPVNINIDSNICVGVDVGVSVPAVCALNNNEYSRCFVGDFKSIDAYRKRMQYEKKRAMNQISGSKGGHGKRRKFEHLDNTDYKSKYFIKTLNHKMSRQIVNFAVEHNAGIIKMEDLHISRDEGYANQLFLVWEYRELQEFIEYKAKEKGIGVLYVPPYNTSITCSRCGNIDKSQRVSQKKFKCNKCGFSANADFNAARNIANA